MSDQLKDIINKGRKSFTSSKDNEIKIKILPMTVGIRVSKQLISLLAPAIGSAVDGVRHDDYLHGAPKSFSDLAMSLVTQLDKIDIEDLIQVLLQGLMVNGKEVNLDEYFAGNYGELTEALEFSLRENFETFFTGKGMKARLITAVQGLLQGTSQLQSGQE